MTPQIKRFLPAAVVSAVLLSPTPAVGGEARSVDGHRVTSSTASGERSTDASRRKRRGPTRGQKAVDGALRGALRARGISRGTLKDYRRLYARARSVRRRLRGARGRELGRVIATLEAIAIRRQLSFSRLHPLFLILRRNTEYWPRKPFPRNRDRVTFRGSELLFEYYRGSGLQIQPLANFKKANLMHGACVRNTGEECRREGLRRLLAEITRASSRRGGFRAWEYFFAFGGGRPPWVSGMAQATGIQAFARASQLLGDPSYLGTAREAFKAFETPPPTGVAARGPLGGIHYLQYSFAPRLFIINAFLQSLIGLYDFAEITGDPTARRLFEAAEPEARAEVPRSDTGDWSTYSFGGRESTREYHELLRELLASTCSRLRTGVYCNTATLFGRYATEPAGLTLLGPTSVVTGGETRVRFALSKLSAVQLTITRDGETALDEVRTFRRGTGSFAWTPKSPGTYSVRLAAKELRTGANLRTQLTGEIESLP
ncbi:MAG: D-glucuronyl C5-epimerase family protein [Thermoleophilaceae bacterium]